LDSLISSAISLMFFCILCHFYPKAFTYILHELYNFVISTFYRYCIWKKIYIEHTYMLGWLVHWSRTEGSFEINRGHWNDKLRQWERNKYSTPYSWWSQGLYLVLIKLISLQWYLTLIGICWAQCQICLSVDTYAHGIC
jgi:hypothetical protein